MGVTNATGIVLKAVRSWQTPTTSYTLFLPGYLYAANRISQVSVSGRVYGFVSTGIIQIETNAFTLPAGFGPNGSPTTDVEAFEQTLQRIVTSPKTYKCMLCDEYGTPIATTNYIGGSGDLLEFSDFSFDGAVAGDIIIMAPNPFAGDLDDMEQCWDAFQADTYGTVEGDVNFAYPWVR
jgi:hypothetical protein